VDTVLHWPPHRNRRGRQPNVRVGRDDEILL
jgi:hypothetical protein